MMTDPDFPGLVKSEETPTGIPFMPPAETVDPAATEGEGMIRWRKSGSGYVITEFEGVPVKSASEPMPADQEIDQMASY